MSFHLATNSKLQPGRQSAESSLVLLAATPASGTRRHQLRSGVSGRACSSSTFSQNLKEIATTGRGAGAGELQKLTRIKLSTGEGSTSSITALSNCHSQVLLQDQPVTGMNQNNPNRISSYQEPTFATDASFDKKLIKNKRGEKPAKPMPLRFVIVHDDVPWTYTYESIIVQGPKSIVAIYTAKSDESEIERYVVKFQMKYSHQELSKTLYSSIKKRYFNMNRGDLLCTRLKSHPLLCKCYGTFILNTDINKDWSDEEDADLGSDKPAKEIWVIQLFENVEGSDLYTFLTDRACKDRQVPKVLLQLACDIVEAIHKLHKHGVYHGDLKPENVMVCVKDGVKRSMLIDFDFASLITDERLKRGTPRYLSPEYVASYRNEGVPLPELGQQGKEFDMWAVGAVFWNLFYGSTSKFYLTSYTTDQLKEEVVRAKSLLCLLDEDKYEAYLKKYMSKPVIPTSPRLERLIRSLLAWYPSDRPSAELTYEKLQHIMAKEYNSTE